MNYLPWWTYLIPCFALGVVLPLRQWKVKPFISGFISGLLTWIIATLVFAMIYEGEMMQITAEIIGIPLILLTILVGIIGGVLCGLSVLSGAMFGGSFIKQDVQSKSTVIH